MVKVASAEFQKNIGRYQDLALTEPVMVTRNGRERTVLISASEYDRLKKRDRRVMTLDDFTDEDIAAIERAVPLPSRSNSITKSNSRGWRFLDPARAWSSDTPFFGTPSNWEVAKKASRTVLARSFLSRAMLGVGRS